jgi:hypothetical protein
MRGKGRGARSLAASLALSACLAAGARAELIAGWDFSQFFAPGALSIDGATGVDTLTANYSNLDPTFSAGAESAAFGTCYFDGQFGASSVDPLDPAAPFVPTASAPGSLESNLDAPVRGFGDVPFDSFTVLIDEGQLFANELAMTATGAVSVVFEADAGAPPGPDDHWTLSFGAKTFSGTSVVQIGFSPHGSSYTDAGSVVLDAIDTPYDADLGPAASETLFVRFTFSPSTPDLPILDNVALSLPEAGGAGAGWAALAALAACRRLRRS